MPEWLYAEIEKAYPSNKYKKKPKSGILTQQINLSYEEGSEFQKKELLSEAKVYLEFLNEDRAVDYEEFYRVVNKARL